MPQPGALARRAPRWPAESTPYPGPDVHRVDARTERGQQRRQHDERADHGEQHDSDAGVGEGAQEVQREDQQRGQRKRNGQPGEEHGPAGSAGGRDDRGLGGQSAPQLFAVAGDDKQAVVHRQPKPERGGQVDRVHRDVGHCGQQAQRQERAHHRHRADGQRQRRGDQAAEDEDKQDEAHRYGDRLRLGQVGLNRRTDRVADRVSPADSHVEAGRGAGAGQRVDAVYRRRVGAVLPAEDQRTRAVPAPQRYGAAGRPVRRHLPRPGGARQPVGERQPARAVGRVVDAGGRRDEQDNVGRRGVKGLVQGGVAAGGGTGWVLEPATAQLGEHAAADAAGDDQRDRGERQYQPVTSHDRGRD